MELIPQYPQEAVLDHLTKHICYDVAKCEIFEYLNNQEHLDEILMQRQIFYGVLEKALEEKEILENLHTLEKDTSEFVETREVSTDTAARNPNLQRFTIHIPQSEVARRVRISDLEGVDRIKLEIGGQIFETIDSKFYRILQKLYNTKEDEIPFFIFQQGVQFIPFQDVYIFVEYETNYNGNKDRKIMYDLHRDYRNLLHASRPIQSYPLMQVKMYKLSDSSALYLGLTIIAIVVDTEYKGDLLLKINRRILKPYQYWMDGMKILALTENTEIATAIKYGINFSRISNSRLLKEDKDDTSPMTIYAINLQVVRYGAGMAGLAFCT